MRDLLALVRVSSPLGHPRLHLRCTDSTNDRARALAIAGAPHGTLVTASAQTAGRGRQGRRWSAPAGSALLMSLVLRGSPGCVPPTTAPGDGAPDRPPLPALLPLIAAVAVCDALDQAQAGEHAWGVKWPNDIVLARAPGVSENEADGTISPGPAKLGPTKLAGILAEGRPQEGWAVLGIGLNVAVRLEDLPLELRGTAATLGEPISAIEPALTRLLSALQRRLDEPAERLLAAYRARDVLRGREIAWSGGSGRAEGIDGEGRLVVSLRGGGRTALDAGEVHLTSSV